MATYSAVAAGEKDADSPITVGLIDKLDQNPHAIAEGATGAPKIQTAAINDNAVTNAKIASAAIKQGNLSTATDSGTISSNSTVVLSGGEYAFQGKLNGTANLSYFFVNTGSYLVGMYEAGGSSTSYVSRYIQASPPYEVGGQTIPLFVFVLLRDNKPICISCAPDPVWANNGPTNIRPDYYRYGKGFKRIRQVPDEIKALKHADKKAYVQALRSAGEIEIEVDADFKNSDMQLIPHPFPSALPTDQIVLIAPDDSVMYDMIELHTDGESVAELLHSDYIRLQNDVIDIPGGPAGVAFHRARWK